MVGIDGRTVDTSLQLGVKHSLLSRFPREDGSVLMNAMLSVDFWPADHLTSIASIYASEFDPRKAFLAMTVDVLTVPVLPATGEIVLDIDTPIRPEPEARAILR